MSNEPKTIIEKLMGKSRLVTTLVSVVIGAALLVAEGSYLPPTSGEVAAAVTKLDEMATEQNKLALRMEIVEVRISSREEFLTVQMEHINKSLANQTVELAEIRRMLFALSDGRR